VRLQWHQWQTVCWALAAVGRLHQAFVRKPALPWRTAQRGNAEDVALTLVGHGNSRVAYS
jgi:hypothetical protein